MLKIISVNITIAKEENKKVKETKQRVEKKLGFFAIASEYEKYKRLCQTRRELFQLKRERGTL